MLEKKGPILKKLIERVFMATKDPFLTLSDDAWNIDCHGVGEFSSPHSRRDFVREDRILLDISSGSSDSASLEIAGPRRNLYHDPASTTVAIVTCGG
jgi:hypothetical protein